MNSTGPLWLTAAIRRHDGSSSSLGAVGCVRSDNGQAMLKAISRYNEGEIQCPSRSGPTGTQGSFRRPCSLSFALHVEPQSAWHKCGLDSRRHKHNSSLSSPSRFPRGSPKTWDPRSRQSIQVGRDNGIRRITSVTASHSGPCPWWAFRRHIDPSLY